MQFIETSIFTRQVTALITDDEYSQLQVALLLIPIWAISSLIAAACAKFAGQRVGAENALVCAQFTIGLYEKTKFSCSSCIPRVKKDDLTPQQIKVLREIVKKEFK